MSNISRRKILGGAMMAAPLLLIAPSASNAFNVAPGINTVREQKNNVGDNKTIRRIKINKRPENGYIYTRINTRVSNDDKNMYSVLLFANDRNGFTVRLEKTVNGKSTTLQERKVSGVGITEALTITLDAKCPILRATVARQSGATLATLASAQPQATWLTGKRVTTSDYTSYGSKYTIDIVDSIDVIPYAVSPFELAFEDNFTGNSIDTSKWHIRDNTYLDYDWGYIKKENVVVSGGTMKIFTSKMNTLMAGKDKQGNSRPRPYSTGYLDTIPNGSFKGFSQQWGRWETRMKMPAGDKSAGRWGCLWLRPDNGSQGVEIDINEFFGANRNHKDKNFDSAHRVCGTVHFDQSGHNREFSWTDASNVNPSDWNTWAVEVTPTKGVQFFVNDNMFHHVDANDPRWLEAYPKGTKMNMRLDMQAGSQYWGEIDPNNNNLDVPLEVDYVRAWSYKG